MKKNIFVFLLVVAALVLLSGCPQTINKNKAANPQSGGGTPPTPGTPNFTVTFNVQGIGTLPAGKETLSVLKGHKIDAADMPSPTHLTWDFIGWYKDKNCNTQWNTTSDTVTADITLYAKWTPKNLSSQNLWKSKETAGTNNHFRIPALTQTKDGKLIAVTDLRYDHAADVGQFGGSIHRVDLVMKHSTDFGLTWSDTGSSGVNLTNVPTPVLYGCGDAAIVADRDSNAVLIIHVKGSVSYHQGKQSVYKLRSNDCGKTWTSTDITNAIYGMNSTQWQRLFITSGKIHQSRYIKSGNYYRIYAAPLIAGFGNTVLYSDDFGDTWKVLGNDAEAKPIQYGDEAKVEELPDGRVILSSRRSNGRWCNIFTYTNKDTGLGSWESDVPKQLNLGNDGGTNGEILILKAVRMSDKTPATIVLLSFPKTSGRKDVTIFWRTIDDNISLTDFADRTKWQGKLIKSGDSAYSTMILQSDNRIGFLYEADGIPTDHYSRGYIIRYESLPISAITSGEYEAAFLTE